jgi:chemotaxis protein CheZ
MQNRAIEIFEACNFQDLTSQRLAKVLRRSTISRKQAVRIIDALDPADAAPAMHGPRLDGDRGQVSQGGVDKMFRGAGRCA